MSITAASLSKEIEEIVHLGRSWGMSDNEISECLIAGTHGEEKTQQGTKKHRKSHGAKHTHANGFWYWVHMLFTVVKYIALAPVVLLMIAGGLYLLMTLVSAISPDAEFRIAQITTPYVYPTMKQARIWLKPLADRLHLASYYTKECLVSNPLYLDPVDNCVPCQGVKTVSDLTAEKSTRIRRYIDDLKPFVLKDYQKHETGFSDLQKMFHENEMRFEQHFQTDLKSNMKGVHSATILFNNVTYDDLMSSNDGAVSISWTTNSVASAQAIRKLFSRPSFVPPEVEVSLEKKIFIEGPLAGKTEFTMGAFAHNWYTQVTGKRRLTFFPHPDCATFCKPMSITLNKGDLLHYQDQYWRIVSDTTHKQDSENGELSIGFSTSYTI